MADRSSASYHAKWDVVAADCDEAIEEEERRETEASNRALGIDTSAPKSQREASEREKNTELKAARRALDVQEKDKEARTVYVDDESFQSREVDLDREMKGADANANANVESTKPVVVHFRRCTDGQYVIPAHPTRAVTKVFVEGCKKCTFTFQCRVLTAFAEVWKSSDIACIHSPMGNGDQGSDIALSTLSTYQLDDVNTLSLRYPSRAHFLSVIHHNATNLSISFDDKSEGLEFEGEPPASNDADQTQIDDDGAAARPSAPAAQSPIDPNRYHQLLSRFVDGRALTERVVRTETNAYPTTTREMKGAAAPPAADAASAARAAEQKARGNECFTSMAYAQAAVYYTEALALDPSLFACLSNRAACWLKLGTPEKAIDDAKACVAQDPTNTKAYFRMGLGHHAQGEYREAVEALLQAEKHAPSSGPMKKQIDEAIRMAQMKARKQTNA